uniref:Uncharacterized protein n=1 Tax=Anguilla anguilla TaxID=7936 RepID=A0A0E9U3Y8_ANGAN
MYTVLELFSCSFSSYGKLFAHWTEESKSCPGRSSCACLQTEKNGVYRSRSGQCSV